MARLIILACLVAAALAAPQPTKRQIFWGGLGWPVAAVAAQPVAVQTVTAAPAVATVSVAAPVVQTVQVQPVVHTVQLQVQQPVIQVQQPVVQVVQPKVVAVPVAKPAPSNTKISVIQRA